MKISPLFVLLLFPLLAFGKDGPRDTAYKALRTLGVERDQALLNRVIEVKGRNGTPQPEKWVIVLDDPLARGGVREIEIANRRIVSERTPVKTYSGSSEGIAMNFPKLNLDSDGAFTIAEAQAKSAKIGFFGADYVLRCDDSATAPIWIVHLLDAKQRSLGSIVISADNGAIVSTDFGKPSFGFRGAPAQVGKIRPEGDPAAEEEYARTHNLGHRLNKVVHRAGASVQEFVTGRRTWDRPYRGEEAW